MEPVDSNLGNVGASSAARVSLPLGRRFRFRSGASLDRAASNPVKTASAATAMTLRELLFACEDFVVQTRKKYVSCDDGGLTPATSALGLGPPLPHLQRDWARRCHICTGTGLAAATSAATTLPYLRWDLSFVCSAQSRDADHWPCAR